jgi:hypothetical protein
LVVVEKIVRRGGLVASLDNVGFSELVLTTCWYIWLEWREFFHGGNIQVPFRSAMSITIAAKNYLLARNKPNAVLREGWKKPPEEKLMLNVDATFQLESGRGGIRVVVRDYTGQCVAAMNRFLPHMVDALIVEAYAFREVLVLAQSIYWMQQFYYPN